MRINSDIKSLELIYDKNKPYIIPFIVIISVIALFIKVEIPLFQNFQKVQKEAKIASLDLDSLKKELKTIESMDKESLDFQLLTTNTALPINKDFSGILNAIYIASQKTGVNLGKFTFQVGDISKLETKGTEFPTINLNVSLNGDINAINSFIETLSKTLPLSDISLIKSSERQADLELLFYYKPITKDPSDFKISPLTQEKKAIIDELSSFNNSPNLSFSTSPSGSSEAKTTNPF